MYRYISAIIKVLRNPSWFENGSECNTELVQNGVVTVSSGIHFSVAKRLFD